MTKSDGASKIYTKAGDKGKTSLIGGARVSKADLRLDAYGTIDELNSAIGLLRADISFDFAGVNPVDGEGLRGEIAVIQNELFNLGSQLACEDPQLRSQLPTIGPQSVARLEQLMDEHSANLHPLRDFIIPGGSRSAAQAHVARTICRRAERICVALDSHKSEGQEAVEAILIQYVNRLSDYFFVLSRHLNRLLGQEEPIWKKGHL